MVNRTRGIVIVLLVIIAAGCAAPPVKKPEEAVFFPPAPELPRVQFLTSFNGGADIQKQSAFDKFVVGAEVTTRLDKPYGVGVYAGKVYVCDTNASVMVFDFNKNTYEPLKGARGPGKLIGPQNISIDADGTKYVTDPKRGQVLAYNRDDDFIKAYGLPGDWKPVDAAPFGEMLYVVDNSNRVIKVFDKTSGEMVKTFGDTGETENRLERPTNLAIDSKGDLYVTDFGRFKIMRYDRDGHFRSFLGKLGDNLGNFVRPRGLSIDREGHIFAVDAAFNNIQIFNDQGRLLMFFGGYGQKPGQMQLPAKVVVDYDNLQYFKQYVAPDFEVESLLFVTNQFGDRMVSVFAYGKEKGKNYPSDAEMEKQRKEMKENELKKLQEEEKKRQESQKPSEKTEGEGAGKASQEKKGQESQKPSEKTEGEGAGQNKDVKGGK